MECAYCGNEVTDKNKYCSAKCKQAAYRNRTVAPTVTKADRNVTASPTVTTANTQLESWAGGSGTDYQQKMGLLSRQYSLIHA